MLSEKIKELRKKKGLTQEELASSLNVSRQAITKWETGEGTPDIDNLKNIALFFHVSVDYLVDSKTEKTLDLKGKFELAEVGLFLFGICLGFVAKSFEFGFVMCLLLPAVVLCISHIVLNKKYEKENDILAQKELQEETLPTDMYGRILDTNKGAKGKRIKQYLVNTTLDASALTIFTIVGEMFGQDISIGAEINLVNNVVLNNILGYIIEFAMTFVVFYILEYAINEFKVKKYNKIGKK